MEIFVKMLGVPDHEALLCMTRNSAMTLPEHRDSIGTLTAGKYADVLIVDGNPDQDVTVLQDRHRLKMVMQAGQQVTAWRPPEAERRIHRFEKAHIYTPSVYLRDHRVPVQVAGTIPSG